MKPFPSAAIVCAIIAPQAIGAAVSLEIVTQQGVQITAPQEWLQRLAGAGVTNVRIRTTQPGDKPAIENIATSGSPIFRVVGLLTTQDKLVVPSAVFGMGDAAKLKDYLDRIREDGPESATAEVGTYGLTKPQFDLVFDALSQPVGAPTEGVSILDLIESIERRIDLPIQIDPRAYTILRRAQPLRAPLGKLTCGAALAIALRGEGLGLFPEKPRGAPPQLVIKPLGESRDSWPAGQPLTGRPSESAPQLMKFINVEINGYTLADAIAAIEPRLGLPLFWDTHTLGRAKIDPAKVTVSLPRSRTYYKRILDKLCTQARVQADVRVDEAGNPFIWITRGGSPY